MRCPKCSFISYDNVDNCLKCGKDISKTAQVFLGSTYNTATPNFLKFEASDALAEEMLYEAEEMNDNLGFADPDLELLVNGGADSGDDEGEIDFVMDGQDDDVEDVSGEEEPLDLGMFEEASEDDGFAFDEEREGQPGSDPRTMDIPDELADISDLSAPQFFEEMEDDESAEIEFDSDVDSAVLNASEDARNGISLEDDKELFLGEDDLTSVTPTAPHTSQMDEELNFELDLGGLSIHEDKS